MTNQLDAAFEVNGRTVTDSASGVTARPWSVGNFGESFVLLVDSDSSEWMFEVIPAGMFELADEEWMTEEDCDICGEEHSQCDHGQFKMMADAIEAVTDNPDEWRSYLIPRRVEWFPLGEH